jgi:hypothetical protein
LVSDSLFGFLPTPGQAVPVDQWGLGLATVASRLANLVAAAVILHSYADMVRGPDRAVLDVHPVRARALVAALAVFTLRARLYLPVSAGVLLVPVGIQGSWLAYAGALGLIFSAWLGGIGVGYLVNLGAVWSAYSESWARVLDALRGDNPRMQAALIYAPGVALAFVGISVELGAIGLGAGLGGWTFGFAWLAIPMCLGAVAWTFVGRLADAYYVKASLLLADVDGAWGATENEDTAGDVYLSALGVGRPQLLRTLRLGWRSLRVHATGGWVAGILVALGGWASADTAVFWGAGATVWVASVAALMPAHDPPWLDDALGVDGFSVWRARLVVAMAYSFGVLAPVCCVLSLRHGSFFIAAALMGLATVCALISSTVASKFKDTAAWAYAASALVLWAGFMGVIK